MTEGMCAIWGTASQIEPITGDLEVHTSPRAGGRYKISGTAKAIIENGWFQDSEFKAKLTTWLVDERLSGIECPYIGFEEVRIPDVAQFFRDIKARRLLKSSERVDRFFKRLIEINYRLGDPFLEIEYSLEKDPIGEYEKWFCDEDESRFFDAYIEAVDRYELYRVLNHLESMNLISNKVNPYSDTTFHVLGPDGLSKLESYDLKTDSKQAFVAMWFDPNDKSVFDEGIKPAIEIDPYGKETGFKAFRVDREHHTDFIMDFMIGNIKRSRFMVADFTSFMIRGHKVLNGNALSAEFDDFQIGRGGVYYEAGFAQGLGIPVIATCRDDQKGHIHFDLKQFNTIYWKDVADLRKQLSERIFGMFV